MLTRLFCLTVLFGAFPAAAQTGSDAAPPTAPACDYEQCALRIEPGFWGQRLVQGRDGVTIDRDGFFGLDLEGAVLDSPLAVGHAQEYASARRRSLISVLGAAVLVSSVESLNTTDEGRIGVGLASVGLLIYGSVEAVRARRESARAIWEYNATLDR